MKLKKLSPEIWLSVPDFPYYEVSNWGRVRSLSRKRICISRSGKIFDNPIKGKFLSLSINKSHGYVEVNLYNENGPTHYLVHILVCELFIGPKPEGEWVDVDHEDGNRTNNMFSNLRWATRSQQQENSRRLGTKPVGERHYKAILTDEQIGEIMARYRPYDRQNSFGAMALEYGVSKSGLSKIFKGVNRAVA